MSYVLSRADNDPCAKLTPASHEQAKQAASDDCARTFYWLERLNFAGLRLPDYKCPGANTPKCQLLKQDDKQLACAKVTKLYYKNQLLGCLTQEVRSLGYCSNDLRLQPSQGDRNRKARIEAMRKKRKRGAERGESSGPPKEDGDNVSVATLKSFSDSITARTPKKSSRPSKRPDGLPPLVPKKRT